MPSIQVSVFIQLIIILSQHITFFSVFSAPSAEVGHRLLFFSGRFDMLSVGQSGHLIILIGCSAGEPVHEKGAERTCYLGMVARVAVFPHNWAILEKELREKIRSCGLRFFGLHL